MSTVELNNNNNNNNNETNQVLSPQIIEAFHGLALSHGFKAHNYELISRPVSGAGDNNYGDVYQVQIKGNGQPPLITILKVAPKNPARRQHMRIVDFYHREVFMYERVFDEYAQLRGAQCTFPKIMPQMLHASLTDRDEFIVFEDLTQTDYVQNSRAKMPTYDLVACALRALAQMHAMSFVLQSQKPTVFADLVARMNDNLFSAEMEEVSVEFGKKYVRRTRELIAAELRHMCNGDTGNSRATAMARSVEFLQHLEDNFKDECFRCVNGWRSAPHAVICHGDFWNNNILYKFAEPVDDASGRTAVSATLIDFQMSRYAPPVLDVVHYLFACTEQELRNAHFPAFLNIYYDTLCGVIDKFDNLSAATIYPRTIFEAQLREFGVFGFCMAAFAIPFFITFNNELLDLDEVAGAIHDLNATTTTPANGGNGVEQQQQQQQQPNGTDTSEKTLKSRELVEVYEMLTPRNLPIFKRRMIGIVEDMLKYQFI